MRPKFCIFAASIGYKDMQKRWVLVPKNTAVANERLQRELGIHPVLVDLLVSRGIDSFDKAKSFFRPQLSALHDPFEMRDMQKAVERIERAIGSNEKI